MHRNATHSKRTCGARNTTTSATKSSDSDSKHRKAGGEWGPLTCTARRNPAVSCEYVLIVVSEHPIMTKNPSVEHATHSPLVALLLLGMSPWMSRLCTSVYVPVSLGGGSFRRIPPLLERLAHFSVATLPATLQQLPRLWFFVSDRMGAVTGGCSRNIPDASSTQYAPGCPPSSVDESMRSDRGYAQWLRTW